MVRTPQPGQQDSQHHQAGQQMGAQLAQLTPKQPHRPQRHQRIHQPKQQPGAYQAEVRHQQQRKRQRHRQRAQIVKGQHLRDQIFERHIALQNAHHQRNLQPDQRAHQQHHAVEQKPKRLGCVSVCYKKQSW